MTTYQLGANANIVQRSDGAWIPADPRNSDWQAYQAWLVAGNQPDPAPVVASPAPQLTTADLAAALVAKGVIEQTDLAASAIAVDIAAAPRIATLAPNGG